MLFAEPATHSGILSFAEHPRNQPFFLGLQSLLELLLYKIGIPRVSHRVYKIDAVSQQQLDQTVVHGVHAVGTANLNESRDLGKPLVPDTRLDSRVYSHQFRG